MQNANEAVLDDLPVAASHHIRISAVLGFLLVHVAALAGVLLLGFSWQGIALAVASYYVRMFAITGGLHRYFSHRTYRLNRFWQFALALFAQTSAQRGVLWWAGHHRHHHRFSDRPADLHSPLRQGFWWSHIGWILSKENKPTDWRSITDFARFPELRWLNKHQYISTILYAGLLTAIWGRTGLVYGYFVSTVLLWHGTFTINSLMHLIGRRVYDTPDGSRNSFILALVTMGEGWHNNHHFYPGSAAQGFRWWEIDLTYYLLWIGERVGIVHDLRRRPSAAGQPNLLRNLANV